MTLPKDDPNYKRFKAYASAHKWLLVTCFGYLGYKNARFGRIEAHEAVTAMGREILLQAKEAAEEMGFNVLHMYVDGIWINKEGCKTVKDFDALLLSIHERTGLPLALDGIFRWIAFLPSKAGCAHLGRQPLFWHFSGRLHQRTRHRAAPPGYAAICCQSAKANTEHPVPGGGWAGIYPFTSPKSGRS
jgi:hypothetical protein